MEKIECSSHVAPKQYGNLLIYMRGYQCILTNTDFSLAFLVTDRLRNIQEIKSVKNVADKQSNYITLHIVCVDVVDGTKRTNTIYASVPKMTHVQLDTSKFKFCQIGPFLYRMPLYIRDFPLEKRQKQKCILAMRLPLLDCRIVILHHLMYLFINDTDNYQTRYL